MLTFAISQLINEHDGIKALMNELKKETVENFQDKYSKYFHLRGYEIIHMEDAIGYFLDLGKRNLVDELLKAEYYIGSFSEEEHKDVLNLIKNHSKKTIK